MAEPNCLCGTCKHWHRQETPPGPRVLGKVNGDCRAMPPTPQLLPNGMIVAMYPTLPEDFPACGFHREPIPQVLTTTEAA